VTLLAGTSAAAIAVPAAATTGTAPRSVRLPATVYVAPDGTFNAHDYSCGSAAYSSVQSAVSAAKYGGAVVVCAGIYREDVTVSKPLSLIGEGHAVIDATGKVNGILVKAPHEPGAEQLRRVPGAGRSTRRLW
jgi:pectin methylesterase-like acyl-CoA thioesterase